jgi:pimeloyl-ACP methyl ester carboxylesterase
MKMYEDQTIYKLRGHETYILVHDAFHSASSWNRVSAILSRLGNKVLPIDLPGHGDDMDSIREQNQLKFAEKISKLIDKEPEKVILVGHGISGATITLAADMRKEKVKKMVYVAAYMPSNSQSVSDLSKINYSTLSQDNTIVTPDDFYKKFPASKLCGERDWSFLMKLAKPEALTTWLDKIEIQGKLLIPRYYVVSNRDEIIPEELSESMIEKNECKDVYEIDTDHNPNLSMPEELAFVLHDIGLKS